MTATRQVRGMAEPSKGGKGGLTGSIAGCAADFVKFFRVTAGRMFAIAVGRWQRRPAMPPRAASLYKQLWGGPVDPFALSAAGRDLAADGLRATLQADHGL